MEITFKLDIKNGYPILILESNKKYLIDTGSNISLSFDKDINNFKFGNENLPLTYYPMRSLQMSFTYKVDGIIGIDILKHNDVVDIDIDNKLISFGKRRENRKISLPLKNFWVPLIVNGTLVDGYLDTGAHHPVVMRKDLLMHYIGQCYEQTFNGDFMLDKYQGTINLANEDVNTMFLDGTIFPKGNYDIYFSIHEFAKHYYGFEFDHNTLYFS